ncbi:Hypothetical protein FKW44_015479 [Caligus rogercresseyi]|uniref:Uncharacterized protein n=1 Tax=Caligus rogercresseyi TaxID=217165 RepID=A0A7T8H118_CALRO|nr:Hypothetical protein FKW44_015479 [Caligus rogercresseyi]
MTWQGALPVAGDGPHSDRDLLRSAKFPPSTRYRHVGSRDLEFFPPRWGMWWPEPHWQSRLPNPKETDEVYDFGGVSIKGGTDHLRPTQCLLEQF